WRVPVNSDGTEANSPWVGFTKENGTWDNGWSWDDKAKYPAPGHRNSSATLNNTTPNGFYWTASPSTNNNNQASILSFNGSTVNVSDNNNRALGFSVRCVKE
ncbi:MAG: fibrobacter succinogenes major paralogous domain-containing protein, partial [Mediterranea sp.]|nr:fibrobacter succinogenes major paralogous domain-containing protein [Mediterranea sp.]